jgi:hypothetical protein
VRPLDLLWLGFLTFYVARGFIRLLSDPSKKAPALVDPIPETFKPESCKDLPIHAWAWSKQACWRCPVCCTPQKRQITPPYCAERGGHFHFKCDQCAYEWAMGTWDTFEKEKEKERKLKGNTPAPLGKTEIKHEST